jgi:murein DD-endopeptidase MepM/ murein hydrolase activator NlpD
MAANAVQRQEQAAGERQIAARADRNVSCGRLAAAMQQIVGEAQDVGGERAGKAAAPASGATAAGRATAGTSGTPGTSKSKKAPQQAAPLEVPEQYAGAYRWPLDAGIISSEYGERWGKKHKGLDLAADAGEPVYAVAAGEVIYAGDGLRGYGNVVIMRHDRRFSSLYAHNSELKVKQGDQVQQGELIALLGNTGHSTGPHVHLEIRDGDAAINPHTMLPKGKLAYAVCAGGACDAEDPSQVLTAQGGATSARPAGR